MRRIVIEVSEDAWWRVLLSKYVVDSKFKEASMGWFRSVAGAIYCYPDQYLRFVYTRIGMEGRGLFKYPRTASALETTI